MINSPPEPTYELVTKLTDDDDKFNNKLNDNKDDDVNMENNPAYTATDTPQDNSSDHHYDFIPANDDVKAKKK